MKIFKKNKLDNKNELNIKQKRIITICIIIALAVLLICAKYCLENLIVLNGIKGEIINVEENLEYDELCTGVCEQLGFKDQNFYNAVLNEYKKINPEFEGDSLSYSNLEEIHELNIENTKIFSTKGIEKLNQLEKLKITNCNLKKIDISNIYTLVEVDLSNNKLEDLDFNYIDNLKKIDVKNNNLHNITRIHGAKLEYLDISNNFFLDYSEFLPNEFDNLKFFREEISISQDNIDILLLSNFLPQNFVIDEKYKDKFGVFCFPLNDIGIFELEDKDDTKDLKLTINVYDKIESKSGKLNFDYFNKKIDLYDEMDVYNIYSDIYSEKEFLKSVNSNNYVYKISKNILYVGIELSKGKIKYIDYYVLPKPEIKIDSEFTPDNYGDYFDTEYILVGDELVLEDDYKEEATTKKTTISTDSTTSKKTTVSQKEESTSKSTNNTSKEDSLVKNETTTDVATTEENTSSTTLTTKKVNYVTEKSDNTTGIDETSIKSDKTISKSTTTFKTSINKNNYKNYIIISVISFVLIGLISLYIFNDKKNK